MKFNGKLHPCPFAELIAMNLSRRDHKGLPGAGTNRCHQFFQFRNLTNVRCLINQAPHMHRKSAAVHIVLLLTKQIEKLGVDHTDQEIKATVRF